jgi:hypothetical protein
MAQFRTKINRFISANNLTSGVIKHKQLGILYLIARLPETEIEAVYQMASEAINTGQPVCTVYNHIDYFKQVQELLHLNEVLAVRATTPDLGSNIIVAAYPEIINYDASQKQTV